MTQKTLSQIVAEKPFRDYANWWKMEATFIRFMSDAIVSQWSDLPENPGDLQPVQNYAIQYLRTVFNREARPTLVGDFAKKAFSQPVYSGEFDALSYAFYRSAFELIARHIEQYETPLEHERRQFTKRVGKLFFAAVHDHLQLNLPSTLQTNNQFVQLQENIHQVGTFLQTGGYLRDNFAFTFSVNVNYAGRQIKQTAASFLDDLHQNGIAYALYEMGYPVILPSAVYLYHTLGEAQHHSSRTIEELFDRVGYEARETDDFDPTGFPSDRVIELWEIRLLR